MTYVTPYAAATAAINALDAIVGDHPPPLPCGSAVVAARDVATPDTETASDIARGQALLQELQRASAEYTRLAEHANAVLAAQTAATSRYATESAQYTAQLSEQWALIDRSVREATQQLIDVGDTSSSWSTGATVPTNNTAVLASRCRTAADACKKYATLVAIGESLSASATTLDSWSCYAPVLQVIPDPTPPDAAGLDAIIARVTQFTAFLQGS